MKCPDQRSRPSYCRCWYLLHQEPWLVDNVTSPRRPPRSSEDCSDTARWKQAVGTVRFLFPFARLRFLSFFEKRKYLVEPCTATFWSCDTRLGTRSPRILAHACLGEQAVRSRLTKVSKTESEYIIHAKPAHRSGQRLYVICRDLGQKGSPPR
ncbi:hypothetical protein RRG08_001938 [Elysia crispata]|uniref:Uncharacterized protein n=1 Tax=Elysia crispata TaxID=231223 RepID=A0AAE1BBB7_9GAST|nr:hypothetical protein RRG08_001938 [Elysia crispata]